MKILQINIFGNLSTGRIAVDLYRSLKKDGHDGIVAFARNNIAEDVAHIRIGNKLSVYVDGVLTRITDKAGFYSRRATKKLIEQIENYNPDIIHLHNLHGYYINIELLFNYLRECGKPVVWTLHDCWAFTGHCCYFSVAECNKWKIGCFKCPQLYSYPKSVLVDNSKYNYEKKKEIFTSLSNLHLVCVSKWLESKVKESFLKDIPCEVIYNGIDTEVFKPTYSQLRDKYGILNKKIVLAVSTSWSDKRKGLEDILQLASCSDDKFVVIIVGLTEKEKKSIPEGIVAITRTDSTKELAELYSMADFFFNASVEETFGLPTVEAMACGPPVIVYNMTALPEVVSKQNGFVVEKHDINTVKKIVLEEWNYNRENISDSVVPYSKEIMMKKYLSTYSRIVGETDRW